MKKLFPFVALLLLVSVTFAQTIEYGDNMELDSVLEPSQTMEYRALHSIKLLPGFNATPIDGHYVLLNLGPGFGLNDNETLCTRAYPIPVKDRLFISWDNIKSDEVQVLIFDTKGTKCLDRTISGSCNMIEADVRNLKSGIYLYKLVLENKEVLNGKFVKE